MKTAPGVLFICFCLALSLQARGTTLPDACGDDKIQFDVKTEKDQPAPAVPADGKAQIVFVGQVDSSAASNCMGCSAFKTTRIGIDGAWVGATHGNSYFAVDVAPGDHHFCAYWKSMTATHDKNIGMSSVTAEAGKSYYFQVEIKAEAGQVSFGHSKASWILSLTPLSEDEGKYRVKTSPVAIATAKK